MSSNKRNRPQTKRAPLRTAKKPTVPQETGIAYDDDCLPMENIYLQEARLLSQRYPKWDQYFTDAVEYDEFKMVRQEIEEESNRLVEKYAWAIPDERCLRIITHFSPLIEIGSGKGYWARLLKGMGADIIAYDKYLPPPNQRWTEVCKGGPEVLKKIRDRTLLLCYPDEGESIAAACLDFFTGDYIIHVGELHSTGTAAGAPVAPFGRTSSAEFQVQLSESFHCVLVAELSVRYPISRDCISIWKRTAFVEGSDVGAEAGAVSRKASGPEQPTGKKGKEGSKQKKGENASVDFVSAADLALLREAALDVQYSEDQDNRWALIAAEDKLPVDRAAPALSHLL